MLTIRVYGLVHRAGHILVSSESIIGQRVLKFPGGGLEHGEGTLDALKREFLEELGQEAIISGHLYTTDFFVPSFLSPDDQVVSIYYAVACAALPDPPVSFTGLEAEQQFHWLKLTDVQVDDFYFPIDKEVVRKLLNGDIILQES
jgi:ADP-ribose pyrophosphatase YjhB (NUDIX family)